MRVALISDIHEDYESLRIAIRQSEQLGATKIVCLGDIVGYSVPFYSYMNSRDANAAVDAIKAECEIVVVGNHDLYAVKRLPSYLANQRRFANWYGLDYHLRQELADGELFLYEENELSHLLRRDNIEYLARLPEQATLDTNGLRLLFTHYAYPDFTGSLTRTVRDRAQAADHLGQMTAIGADIGLSGNDHQPGFFAFSRESERLVGFDEEYHAVEVTWAHGPAVARGTTPNGFMVLDTDQRTITAIPLGSPIHTVPTSF